MLEVLIVVICFILLIWSSITDLRTTEVPDWLTHTAIVLGFVLNGADSLLTHSWAPLIASGIGFGICFVIGMVTYYGGQWGGADSKILMALGSLVGVQFRLESTLVSFALYFLVVGALYGIMWSCWIAFKRRDCFVPAYKTMIRTRFAIIVRFGGYALMLVFGLVSFFLQSQQLRMTALLLAVFFPFIAHVMLFVKSVEKCMVRKATPNELLEGDWITQDIVVAGKTVFVANKTGIPQTKIDELKQIGKKHHVTIMVKDGIPFVPSFLVAFTVAVFAGSPLRFL